ncbi:hypothetical protein BX666DRAFT_2003000 [Dichotomocladium elegans]|nr:hypothetical protein BX666DRAFT_2003000 [Dichotomocladium elegans]
MDQRVVVSYVLIGLILAKDRITRFKSFTYMIYSVNSSGQVILVHKTGGNGRRGCMQELLKAKEIIHGRSREQALVH